MRESIGGTWLMSIVIVFIVLFTSFLALSVNYSKAFKVKNGIINILEKGQGLNNKTSQEISDYLSTAGYAVYGSCDTNEKGCMKSNSAGASSKYKYCIYANQGNGTDLFGGEKVKTYYKVKVFFRIDLPIVGNILTFPISGETKTIYTSSNNVTNLVC